MATTTPVSVDEYLKMNFEGPAPEYVGGELVPRGEAMTMVPHGRIQVRLASWFEARRESHKLYATGETHLRLSDNLVRIADLSVFRGGLPEDDIPTRPPFLVAEIVSRDDRYVDLLTKLAEYRQWGVEHVWLVGPWLRKLYVFDGKLRETDRLEIPELGLAAEPAEIFD